MRATLGKAWRGFRTGWSKLPRKAQWVVGGIAALFVIGSLANQSPAADVSATATPRATTALLRTSPVATATPSPTLEPTPAPTPTAEQVAALEAGGARYTTQTRLGGTIEVTATVTNNGSAANEETRFQFGSVSVWIGLSVRAATRA